MTILTLKVSLCANIDSAASWSAVIEIDSFALLEDLHFAIQNAVRFDNDHLFDFFIARTPRSRDRVVLDEENGYADEISIDSLFPLPAKKNLYYLFDYGDNWLFKIAKTRKPDQAPLPGVIYPRLVQEVGVRPIQYADYD